MIPQVRRASDALVPYKHNTNLSDIMLFLLTNSRRKNYNDMNSREGSNYVIIHPKANFRSHESKVCAAALVINLKKLMTCLVLFSIFVENREVSERTTKTFPNREPPFNSIRLLSVCLAMKISERITFFPHSRACIITLRLSAPVIIKAQLVSSF